MFLLQMLLLLGADAVYAELQMLCVSRTCAVAMGALILCDVDALAENAVFAAFADDAYAVAVSTGAVFADDAYAVAVGAGAVFADYLYAVTVGAGAVFADAACKISCFLLNILYL